jgi:glucose/arabinose dehydrogenase
MDGCPEIFSWGFRNPWRWSFDPVSDQLWVGDVGQADWEEIDRVEIGRNYGWNILEGTHCFAQTDCDTAGLTTPITEYSHDLGSSVTGGYVYRGSALTGLNGDYLYGDFGSGRIWRLIQVAQGGSQCELLQSTNLNISSFAQDRNGEIYIVSYGDGTIYKLVSAGGS